MQHLCRILKVEILGEFGFFGISNKSRRRYFIKTSDESVIILNFYRSSRALRGLKTRTLRSTFLLYAYYAKTDGSWEIEGMFSVSVIYYLTLQRWQIVYVRKFSRKTQVIAYEIKPRITVGGRMNSRREELRTIISLFRIRLKFDSMRN